MNPARPSTRLALLLALAGLPATASAQVTVDWTAPTRGVSVAADAANNVFTVDFEQALGAEMKVTKRDVNGNLLWVAFFDQTSPTQWERASWITTDSEGNAIACGSLMSGYSNPVVFASIVMKVSPDGEVLWRNVFANGADGGTKKCLVDAQDNIYVLGIGSGPPGYVTRVNRFSPAGAAVWTYFDADGIGAPVNFKLTPDDQLVIAGRGIFGSINGYARIDLDGNKVWSLPGIQSLTVGDVAGDAQGNCYVVHGEYVANGGSQVKKLDPSGQIVWDETYALSAFRIEVGSDGNPVACGFPNPSQGGASFIKLDPQGGVLWANPDADGPAYALLLHAQLLLDENDDAYLAAGTLFEMAVCKVRGTDGTSLWTKGLSGSYANGIALGPHDSSLFVVGGTTARLIDATRSPWVDLGQGLAGADGVPLFFGEGDLLAGQPMFVSLTGATPDEPATLVVGLSELSDPFKGGILVPSTDLLILNIVTSPLGNVLLYDNWPAGIPSGTTFWFQYWIEDVGAPKGLAASNAVKALVP